MVRYHSEELWSAPWLKDSVLEAGLRRKDRILENDLEWLQTRITKARNVFSHDLDR